MVKEAKEAFGWAGLVWLGSNNSMDGAGWLGVDCLLAYAKAPVTCKRFKLVSIISNLS